jgi:hypothetical protein
MASKKDTVLFLSILIGSALIFGSVAGVALPGTSNLPSIGDLVGDEGEDPRYKVSTSINVGTSLEDISLREKSFEYDTSRCVLCTLSFADTPNLAFGGVNKAELQLEVYDSSDRKLVDTTKYLGEVGSLQTESVGFSFSNVPKGDYRLVYTVRADADISGENIEKSLTKNIRVPETVEGIN